MAYIRCVECPGQCFWLKAGLGIITAVCTRCEAEYLIMPDGNLTLSKARKSTAE